MFDSVETSWGIIDEHDDIGIKRFDTEEECIAYIRVNNSGNPNLSPVEIRKKIKKVKLEVGQTWLDFEGRSRTIRLIEGTTLCYMITKWCVNELEVANKEYFEGHYADKLAPKNHKAELVKEMPPTDLLDPNLDQAKKKSETWTLHLF
jgi:hypothetical protein